MKQPRFKPKAQTRFVPSAAQEISSEFIRIGKLTKQGKEDEAWRAANDLYAKYPNDPTANFTIALILYENNQKADALPYAEVAVKFAPNTVRNLVFLGKLYVDLGMIEYAPSILNKAFYLDSTAFQAPWALALYYLQSGQGSRAMPYFDSALKVAPTHAKVEIRENRANCLQATGRLQEAETEFKLLFEVPHYKVSSLTQAALLCKNDHHSDYAMQIKNMLDKSDLTDRDRSSLFLCLGRLYENNRDYDGAFLNFEKSKENLLSTFSFEDFMLHVNDRIKAFTPEVFKKFRGYGNESRKPIFVVGMPRSGTTLTEQIIAAHSQAEGVGELGRVGSMYGALSSGKQTQGLFDKMTEVGPELWKDIPLQYLNLVNVLAPNAQYTVDKMPHNFLSIGFIHLCFPNAKIIHCKRNPLDNFISSFQNAMNSAHGYTYDQVGFGEYYIGYLKLMDHWKSVVPKNVHELSYENLTANPEIETRKLLEFLELPWENECLKFNERKSTVMTFSQLQVREPINSKSVDRWKHYEKHLSPIKTVFEKSKIPF